MQEWKSPAAYAVRKMATLCMQHPRLEEDPTCVIATVREDILKEIEEAEWPEPTVTAPVLTPDRNGKHRG